jgi:chemotaxis protein methyltransferase CheR
MNDVLRKKSVPELEMIQNLAFSSFGLDLRSGKEELITARISKVMRKQNISTVREYYNYLMADGSGAALTEMIDALTTNYTSFFREDAHFKLLRKEILSAAGMKNIRIWSAGCSTGEEPYSIAFCAHDAGRTPTSTEVVATDISMRVLRKAGAAIYKDSELKGIPVEDRRRYFLAGVKTNEGWFKVKSEIRRFVQFSPQNLIQPLEVKGSFDVIFCRNVMIYFNNETRQEVVRRIERKINPGGYLLIGHSETLNGVKHSLRYISPSVYRSSAS